MSFTSSTDGCPVGTCMSGGRPMDVLWIYVGVDTSTSKVCQHGMSAASWHVVRTMSSGCRILGQGNRLELNAAETDRGPLVNKCPYL